VRSPSRQSPQHANGYRCRVQAVTVELRLRCCLCGGIAWLLVSRGHGVMVYRVIMVRGCFGERCASGYTCAGAVFSSRWLHLVTCIRRRRLLGRLWD
jgi:hypothetical protein